MLGLDVALPIPINPAPSCTECVQSCRPASSNPSEVWGGHDTANGLHSTRRWCILVQR
jgi:hypothetical protein